MQLLADRTTSWRNEAGKTVLHIAFENGVETTQALLPALRLRNNPRRIEEFAYVDKSDRSYSPQEYISEVLKPDEYTKGKLMALLGKGGARAQLLCASACWAAERSEPGYSAQQRIRTVCVCQKGCCGH